MVIHLEDLTETILIEEGVTPLIGIDILVNGLGYSWKNMERVFVKAAQEFSQWRPREKEILITAGQTAILPEDFISIKAVRYGFLIELPRFQFEKFDEKGLQWDPATRELKVFPPISEIRVSYAGSLSITNNIQITDRFTSVAGEQVIEDIMKASFRTGTLTVRKNNLEMTVQSVEEDVATLSGDLGTGTINLTTREFTLNLDETNFGDIYFIYYPKYKVITDYDVNIGHKVFPKFYGAKLLTGIAAVRAQVTQEVLHNINIDTDMLTERAQALKMEANKLMSAIPFNAIAPQ